MTNARFWLRAGLVALAAAQGLVGAVQLLLPKAFYEDFPSRTHPWVSLLPPYNEHLMRDVGALTLAYVLVLGVAAVTLEPTMVRTALAANLVFTVPHLVFHSSHLDHFPTAQAVTQTIALALTVALPCALLCITQRSAPWTLPRRPSRYRRN
ncbi:hypothetical protein [Embleya scabrispora]|uniref:hypothetical protein n=1 Tax=Embleya scabrispora TaxID=159449 RepID=UPI0003A57B17|nr:hypothetical protein [Embleya scabrispora]MYS86674.1 hypothetical protein [Streptomyces sp. SID5474]